MNKEEYIETMLDEIYSKYRIYFFNEGTVPNLVTLSPQMCSTVIDYFQLPEFSTVFGMKVLVSSEVTDFNKIGVYHIERPDEWKNTI